MRIECPECHTSYTHERLGLALQPETAAIVTVGCVLCRCEFDVALQPTKPTIVTTPGAPLGWFQRVVLRRVPVDVQTVVVPEHTHEVLAAAVRSKKGK